jgi:transcriptional regulator with XRE-family HTH domain
MESQLSSTAEWETQVGQAVRELRLRADLTQAELAERANVSLSSIRYLESGKGSSLATLIRVVRALDRSAWLESLAPPAARVSPIALLQERRDAARRASKRVRHGRPRPERT